MNKKASRKYEYCVMEYVRYLRQKRNDSQRILAEYLNIAVSTYSNYEAHRRSIGFGSIRKLAEYFGMTVEEITTRAVCFGEENERRSGEAGDAASAECI